MKLRNIGRGKLYRFQDVPGDFDVGMMLGGAASGGGALRWRQAIYSDEKGENGKSHSALCAIDLPRPP